MNLITKLAIGAALAAMLGISTTAHAQDSGKTTRKAKVSSKAKAKSKTNAKPARTTLPKAKDYDFTADEIDGDRALPNLDRILGMGDSKHKSLIRLREHFITEIIRSADML